MIFCHDATAAAAADDAAADDDAAGASLGLLQPCKQRSHVGRRCRAAATSWMFCWLMKLNDDVHRG